MPQQCPMIPYLGSGRISASKEKKQLPNGQKEGESVEQERRCVLTNDLQLFFFPPDIHWQCGDLHKPLQVPDHIHAREGGGVSQPKLL